VRVLVVEDVHRLADDIAEGLRDHGFAVDVSYDGVDAASKLELVGYDVVVLDRDLPGLSGDTLCRIIAQSDNPAMVLMLTAAGTSADRTAGLSIGADDYLPKPFHFPEFILRVRALARRRPTAQPRILHTHDIALDSLNYTVTRNGRRLDL
jgi:DNA-binding response OmpR family regulator